MKKTVIAMLVLSLCAVARADELSDAMKAWESRDFARALPVLTRLAKAGNPGAQLQLGEMYGFGEGVREDPAAAAGWLDKAAAAGHPDAAASLALVRERALRKAEITRFGTDFDGGSLKLSNYNCAAPRFPAVSESNAQIAAVKAELGSWSACYQGFSTQLKQALPLSKAIPADLARLMSADEHARALQRVDQVYAATVAAVRQRASVVVAEQQAWEQRTSELLMQRYAGLGKVQRQALSALQNDARAHTPVIARDDLRAYTRER